MDLAFSRLAEHGLQLKAEKCFLFQEQVKFLGHIVSSEGIETDPDKIRAVKEWPRPQTLQELRRFTGFSSYYRKFIKGYAGVAKPLHELTGILANQKPRRGKKAKIGDLWKEEHETAFQELKKRFTETPILGFPNFELPFVLETDASEQGLGAVLSQVQDGKMRVIAYASRSLRPAEKNMENYSSMKLELWPSSGL